MKSTADNIQVLIGLAQSFRNGRDIMYRQGGPSGVHITNMETMDHVIRTLENALYDVRKLMDVEKEAVTLDQQVQANQGPEGRNYYELFTILSPTMEKVGETKGSQDKRSA